MGINIGKILRSKPVLGTGSALSFAASGFSAYKAYDLYNVNKDLRRYQRQGYTRTYSEDYPTEMSTSTKIALGIGSLALGALAYKRFGATKVLEEIAEGGTEAVAGSRLKGVAKWFWSDAKKTASDGFNSIAYLGETMISPRPFIQRGADGNRIFSGHSIVQHGLKYGAIGLTIPTILSSNAYRTGKELGTQNRLMGRYTEQSMPKSYQLQSPQNTQTWSSRSSRRVSGGHLGATGDLVFGMNARRRG